MTGPSLRDATPADAGALARIYNHYVRETIITFEEEAVPEADMAARVAEVQGAGLPWLVAEEGGRPVGYAYAGKWKGRCAYRYSVESGIYLDPACTGRGIGAGLYRELLARLRPLGIRVVIAGISLPNPASVALHERLGFEPSGRFREVGFKFGRWIDVGYWQAVLSEG